MKIVSLLALFFFSLCNLFESEAQNKETLLLEKPKIKDGLVDLKSVLKQINDSFQASDYYLQKDKNIKVRIEEASVTFKVSKSKSGGGSLNIWILKANKSWKSERVSQITFNLKQLPHIGLAPPIKDELSILINNAAQEFYNANKEGILGLKGDSFELELTFGITSTRTGGLSFKVLSAGIESEGELENLAEHAITLKFKLY